MIPLQLTIEGLYSYQQRHVIDFQKLTAAGIFGIFGAVGSGKSSILEAISYVLYGETERMHSRENRTYNMMNLKSNRSYIEFDFINHQNEKYRATREFKRNSRNFEDVRTPSVVVYRWIDSAWSPLQHSNLHEIIGLSYANFKRTTIIPQGQFKEFLDLGATDRTKMMMEIFDLQRFDLHKKTTSLADLNRTELDKLDGQLKGFENVSEEEIATRQGTLAALENIRSTAEKQNASAQQKFQQFKNLKTDFDSLAIKSKQLEISSQQIPSINDLESTTERYDRYSRIFGPLLDQRRKIQRELSSKTKQLSDRQEISVATGAKLKRVQDDLFKLAPAYDGLDGDRKITNELSLILQIKEASAQLKTVLERVANGTKMVKDKEVHKKALEELIAALGDKLKNIRSKRIDQSLLSTVGEWFQTLKNLKQNKTQAEKTIDNHEAVLAKVLEDLQGFPLCATSIEAHDQKIKSIQEAKKTVLEQRTALEVQQKLTHYTDALHDGAACPLCGALEHPNVLQFENVSAEIVKSQAEIEQLQLEESRLQRQFMEAEKLRERKELIEKQIEAEKEIAHNFDKKIAAHQAIFGWPDFNRDDEAGFIEKRNAAFALEKEIEKCENEIAKQQKLFDDCCRESEKFNKTLTDLKVTEGQKTATIAAQKKQLEKLSYDAYETVAAREIEEQISVLQKAILKTEKDHKELTDSEKGLTLTLAKLNAEVSQLKERVDELTVDDQRNNSLLEQALFEAKVADINTISEILSEPLDVVKNRARVQEFRVSHATLVAAVSELKEKLKNFTFDETEFVAVTTEAEQSEAAFRRANDAVVESRAEIARLSKQFRKKEELLRDYAALKKRDENLRLMLNLFKGAGFVQYAASIYLRQLCDHANVRFHRMTRNQLSLQLSDSNEFEIIDYLNEGKRRSVKTLSGGQAFQVSLSLALALAESVSANLKAEQNFFFIDEGFGTQDPESVHVIFETLTALQKENRIVGIISHVEELKEKMPVALHITKHPEHGSQIEVQ